MTTPVPNPRHGVVIAGGGPAALECALALRATAEEHVDLLDPAGHQLTRVAAEQAPLALSATTPQP